jgi:chemotaxis family two-component system sensor kinase Cph1
MKLDIDRLTFDRCEDEKIHIPESIQSYGYLFALNHSTGIIEIISENVLDLFTTEGPLIGSNFFDLLDEDEEEVDFFQETYRRAKSRHTRLPIKLRFEKTTQAR